MKPSILEHLQYESSRHVIIDRARNEYPVKKKKDKECWYINVGNSKVTVTKLIAPWACWHRYWLDGWIFDYPCPAFDYWFMCKEYGKKLSIEYYKRNYLQRALKYKQDAANTLRAIR